MNLDRLRETLIDSCRLTPDQPVIAGVSGGPDSLCLLLVLKQLGYPVIAAHFNHLLRGQAGRDAEQTRRATELLGVRLVYGQGRVNEYAQAEGLSVEEAARILRYRFLFEQARAAGAQAVAVGHTADDQVETVLMHVLRGTGLAGLRGMSTRLEETEWSSEIPLIRPLLEVWRPDTVACCSAAGLEPCIDLTNFDPKYARNRVRLRLIPTLERYNPRVKQAILRLASAAAGDYEIVAAAALDGWRQALVEEGDNGVILSLDKLRLYSRGLLRNVLRIAFDHLRPGLRDIDYDLIERVVSFVEQPSRSLKLDLASSLRVSQGGGKLFLYEQATTVMASGWPQLAQREGVVLDVPGHLRLDNGWLLAAEWFEREQGQAPWQEPNDGWHAWLDSACLDLPLEVRARRAGDRFQPLGMQGHSLKLSDYFVNEKLPQLARERWPLICSRGQIVWLPGFRPAHQCRVTPESRRILHLYVQRLPAENE